MATARIHIPYHLTFTSAFHFGTGLRDGLIHRVVARDADGFLYVPGSTFKGVLRDRCEQLAHLFDLPAAEPHTETSGWAEAHPHVDIIVRIFGSRFQPGHLYFDDAYLPEEEQEWFEPPYKEKTARERKRSEFRAWQTEKRTQVSMSRLTRTAQPGRLYHSEYGIRGLHFHGSIHGLLEGTPLPDSDGNYPLLLLVAGLLSLGRIGGKKSTGAGAFNCEIKDNQIQVDNQPLEVETLLNELVYLDAEFYDEWREEAEE